MGAVSRQDEQGKTTAVREIRSPHAGHAPLLGAKARSLNSHPWDGHAPLAQHEAGSPSSLPRLGCLAGSWELGLGGLPKRHEATMRPVSGGDGVKPHDHNRPRGGVVGTSKTNA